MKNEKPITKRQVSAKVAAAKKAAVQEHEEKTTVSVLRHGMLFQRFTLAELRAKNVIEGRGATQDILT